MQNIITKPHIIALALSPVFAKYKNENAPTRAMDKLFIPRLPSDDSPIPQQTGSDEYKTILQQEKL